MLLHVIIHFAYVLVVSSYPSLFTCNNGKVTPISRHVRKIGYNACNLSPQSFRFHQGVHKRFSTYRYILRWEEEKAALIRLSSSSASSPDHDSDDKSSWKAGNVERDIRLLRTAILKSQAEDERKEIERKLMLDEFAKSRRAILPDFIRYICGPLLLSVVLCRILESTSKRNISSLLLRVMFCSMDVHYWLVVIFSPTVSLLFYNIIAPPKENRRKKRTASLLDNTRTLPELDSMTFMNPKKEKKIRSR